MTPTLLRHIAALTTIPCLALVAAAPAKAQGASLRDGIDQLATELIRNMTTPRILRVAVSDFPDLRGATSDLGRYVAERLTTRLSAATNKFAVTERRRLQQVVSELSLNQGDLVDPRTARRVGEMLGVDALLVGTVSPLGDRVELDSRVVEIETNNVVTQGSVSIIKDQVVDGLLAAGLVEGQRPAGRRDTSAVAGGPPPRAPAPAPARRLGSWTGYDLLVEVTGVERGAEGTRVIFTVKRLREGGAGFCVTPGSAQDREARYHAHLIDDAGSRYASLSGRVGRETFTSANITTILPEVPSYRYELVFEALEPEARTVSLVIPPNQSCAANVVIGPINVLAPER